MGYLRRQINFVTSVAGSTFKEWAAYRTHSLLSIFVGPAYFAVQFLIWSAVFSGKETINGLTLEQMLAYYGISTLIVYLTMDFADWNLQMLIRTGKFITFALRPMHHRRFALAQKIGHRTLGFLFEFIPVLFIFIFIFKINLLPASFFWMIISIILSFFMTFYLNYIIGLLGFWLIKTDGLRSASKLFANVLSGALIPLTFFPEGIQKLMFVLPFQFTTYVPAMVHTGHYSLAGITLPLWQIVALQGFYTLVMLFLSEIIYRAGIKRFSGVGT